MSNRWYYQMLLEEFGPVTEQQLQQLIEEGTLSSDDLVRAEDSPAWMPVADLMGRLATDADEPADCEPADIEDLSELSFSFEETGPSERRTARSAPEHSSSQRSTAGPPGDSPIKPTSLRQSSAFQPEEQRTEAYYCKSLGQILGPMQLAELIGMAESGSLSDSDPVRCGESGAWQPASAISELSATFLLSDRDTTDAAMMSETTQKRLGPGAVASQIGAPAPGNPVVKPPAAAMPSEPAIPVSPPPVAATDSKELPGKAKVRRKKAKKGEDELLSEIFDDVFADGEDESEKPSRTSAVTQSAPPTFAAPSAPPDNANVTRPVPSNPAYSSPSSSPASLAGAAMARAAASNHASHKPSRGQGISFEGPVKFVTIAILLIAVIGGLIWQFGLPSLPVIGFGTGKYAARMTEAVTTYKALGEKPTSEKWEEFCRTTRSEFMPYYKSVVEGGASGPADTACMEGLKAIVVLTSTKLEDEARRKELVSKIEGHIVEMQK